MLVVITTHPIQYQVPLWQALARDGRIPFEVWFMTHHAVEASHDVEFGKSFAWDLEMLAGYPHRLMKTAAGATPTTFRACRFVEPLAPMLRRASASVVWIQGWQVMAYWQAAWAARAAGCKLWLRAESNNLAPVSWWKKPIKRIALGSMFSRVDQFFCIGSANKELYLDYGVQEARLSPGPYSIDNERFAAQAAALRPERSAIRRRWGIAEDAFCVMFCGKFIPKKNPLDLLAAAMLALARTPQLHLLLVGSGELGGALRDCSNVVFDVEAAVIAGGPRASLPRASFVGFLNQTDISRAYVAADCLVLPSDFGETWGLVVNEAMASGLPCIISDRCGSAQDIGAIGANTVFPFGDTGRLATEIARLADGSNLAIVPAKALEGHSFERTIESVTEAYCGGCHISK
jgi:glycosyltransferase involved in cell wall biosynthesis